MRIERLVVAVFGFLLLVAAPISGQQPSLAPLSNKDVLDMQRAKLSADTIIAAIESFSCNFDISPYALKELKAASVPDEVILAMMQPPAMLQVPIDRLMTGNIEMYAKHMNLRGVRHANQQSSGLWKASEHTTTVKAVSYKSLLYNGTEAYQIPGSSHTTCDDTTSGNINATARPDYSGGAKISGTVDSNTTTSCNTTYRPPRQEQAETRTVYNYNIVESENYRFVVSCRVNVVMSKCAPLIPGNVFPVEVKGKHMWVTAYNENGNQKKSERAKYDILRVEPLH